MSTEIIVCGLTEWEKKEIREHKGECKHCMHYESFVQRGFNGEKIPVLLCIKNGERKRLKEEKTDCEDWFLDTR